MASSSSVDIIAQTPLQRTAFSHPSITMKKMISRLLLLSSSAPTSLLIRPTVAWLAGHHHGASTTRTPPGSQLITTALRYQSTSDGSDDSAASRSRAPFRMPKNSPDDSVPLKKKTGGDDNDVSSWNQLGLWTELVDALTQELKLEAPTPVQNLVIPTLVRENIKDTAFLAATGSGECYYCVLHG